MTENPILESMTLDDPADIKLIFSIKHNRILKLLAASEMSIFELSKTLDMNPGTVHYYLKNLEKHGLIRQVREEVKGGVLKKYYRAVAKRILIDTPDFNEIDRYELDPNNRFNAGIVKALKYYGYRLPPKKREAAEAVVAKYNKRLKEIESETQNETLERTDTDPGVGRAAHILMMSIRILEDEELGRIHREFNELFK